MADYLSNYNEPDDILNQRSQDIPLTSGQQILFATYNRDGVPVSGMVLPSAEWNFFDTNQSVGEDGGAIDDKWPHPLVGRDSDDEIFPSGLEELKQLGYFTEDWWEASGHLVYLGSGTYTQGVPDSGLYDKEDEKSIFGPNGLTVPFSNAQDQQSNVISDFSIFNPQIYHDGIVNGSLGQPIKKDTNVLSIQLPFVSDPIVTVGGLNVYNQYGGFDAGFKG